MKLGDVFRDAEVARLCSYRAPYPAAVFTALRRLLVAPGTVLDAGAGKGALARGMVTFAQRIDALDPSEAMIATGRQSRDGDDRRIRWIVGRAEDAPISPPYGLITCGASLHWMDLDVVLPRFGAALAPGAVLAIADTDNVHGPYHDDVLAVIRRYSELEHHVGTQGLIGDLAGRGTLRRARCRADRASAVRAVCGRVRRVLTQHEHARADPPRLPLSCLRRRDAVDLRAPGDRAVTLRGGRHRDVGAAPIGVRQIAWSQRQPVHECVSVFAPMVGATATSRPYPASGA